MSPPSRGRGSKHLKVGDTLCGVKSPPSRGRGSKQSMAVHGPQRGRRLLHGGVDRNPATGSSTALNEGPPFTGAGVETVAQADTYAPTPGASFTEGWIEKPTDRWPRPYCLRRP